MEWTWVLAGARKRLRQLMEEGKIRAKAREGETGWSRKKNEGRLDYLFMRFISCLLLLHGAPRCVTTIKVIQLLYIP